jgi:hypothetical protein
MKGRSAGTVSLTKDRHHSLMVGASGLASLASHKPPHYFSGSFKLKQEGDGGLELLKVTVECRPGEDFKAVANQKKKPESLDPKKKPLEKLDDDLFERRLAFVKTHKFSDVKEIISKRDEFLTQLLTARPKNVAAHILHAEVHAGEGKKDKKKLSQKNLRNIQTILKKARALSYPRAVANYFGAQSDDEEASLDQRKVASAKQKKMEEQRKNLATLRLLEAKILLRSGKPKPTRRALRQARRWQDQPSKEHQQIVYELLKKEKLHGLALQNLNEQLKETPFDKKLLDEKIELFQKLGFDECYTRQIRLLQKVNEYHSGQR